MRRQGTQDARNQMHEGCGCGLGLDTQQVYQWTAVIDGGVTDGARSAVVNRVQQKECSDEQGSDEQGAVMNRSAVMNRVQQKECSDEQGTAEANTGQGNTGGGKGQVVR